MSRLPFVVRQLYAFVLALLLLVLPLSACTPEAAPEQAATNSTVITFGAPDADRVLYAPIIERFNEQHADIRVQFVDLNAAQAANGGNPLRSVVSAANTAIGFVRPDDIANRYVWISNRSSMPIRHLSSLIITLLHSSNAPRRQSTYCHKPCICHCLATIKLPGWQQACPSPARTPHGTR